MLDPWFHATTSAASVWAAGDDLGLGARCLVPKVSLCVNIPYAKAVEAVKLLVAFSASSVVSMWIRGEISSEPRLRNCSQSVWVSTGVEISLAPTLSSMWKKIGRCSESRTSKAVPYDKHFNGTQYQVCYHFLAVYSGWEIEALKSESYHQICPRASHLKGLKRDCFQIGFLGFRSSASKDLVLQLKRSITSAWLQAWPGSLCTAESKMWLFPIVT